MNCDTRDKLRKADYSQAMRPYEFRPGEVITSPTSTIGVLLVDLDAIVMLEESSSTNIYGDEPEKPTSWGVTFANGEKLLTKAGFDRILLAWKSK